MAAPVIDTTQSVLGYLQHEYFEFQAGATNSPDSWSCTNLPVGITLDTSTGLVSGSAAFPGVYVFYLTATNASGSSTPVKFTCGIEASTDTDSSVIDVQIDVATREVTFDSSSDTETKTNKVDYLASLKRGDDIVFSVRFVKNGVCLDLDLQSLKCGAKEIEPESVLFTSTAWRKVGYSNNARYRILTTFDSNNLTSSLSSSEDDGGTKITALMEFEWVEKVPSPIPSGWPSTLVGTSQTFKVQIVRDLIANS